MCSSFRTAGAEMDEPKRPRWVLVVGSGTILVATAWFIISRLPTGVARLREAGATMQQLTSPPESIPATAIDQRYRLRRAVVQSMRADLLKLVSVESAFVADSGYPTAFLRSPYSVALSTGNIFTDIRLLPNGWSATITNPHTAITCSLTVGYDSALARPIAEQPVCVGERASPP